MLVLVLVQAAVAGCGTPPAAGPAGPAWQAGPGQVLLLGEVHDNAWQHALRLAALRGLVARGDRPALLMEQIDRERQGAIDAQQATAPEGTLDARVAALVDAAGGMPGWDLALYRPYIGLALQHGLPIVAANVSRADARRIISLGLAAQGFEAELPADIALTQASAIEASHCGQVDGATARRLAQAQVARDQFMARLVIAHAARGAVLLAGNGHVRADLGVPRWLPGALRARTHAVGYLEAGDPLIKAFDQAILTPAQARHDPCAGLRLPARPLAGPDQPGR